MLGSITTWQGYTIKRGERDMMWVSKDGVNPVPGACCFNTAHDARQGIAALELAQKIGGNVGENFWNLLELTRKDPD